jgi:hypothetical protein
MTVTTALSPARDHAFHATEAAQQKRGGHVQFSLPPVDNGGAAPGGTNTAPPIRTQLPIAIPVAGGTGLGTATPLPASGSGSATAAAATAPPGHGNVLSARLISRLYQQQV